MDKNEFTYLLREIKNVINEAVEFRGPKGGRNANPSEEPELAGPPGEEGEWSGEGERPREEPKKIPYPEDLKPLRGKLYRLGGETRKKLLARAGREVNEGSWSDFAEYSEDNARKQGWRFYLKHNFFNLPKEKHEEMVKLMNAADKAPTHFQPNGMFHLHDQLVRSGIDSKHDMLGSLYREADELEMLNRDKAEARAR